MARFGKDRALGKGEQRDQNEVLKRAKILACPRTTRRKGDYNGYSEEIVDRQTADGEEGSGREAGQCGCSQGRADQGSAQDGPHVKDAGDESRVHTQVLEQATLR